MSRTSEKQKSAKLRQLDRINLKLAEIKNEHFVTVARKHVHTKTFNEDFIRVLHSTSSIGEEIALAFDAKSGPEEDARSSEMAKKFEELFNSDERLVALRGLGDFIDENAEESFVPEEDGRDN